MKKCSKCKIQKPATTEFFHRHKGKSDGLSLWCKLCVSEYSAARYQKDPGRGRAQAAKWRAANPERQKYLQWKHALTRYGLTPEIWSEMLKAYGGCCPGCAQPFTNKICVDHDHNCCPGRNSCGGCVRGLLCDNCNRTLGNAHDNPHTLRNLATYLDRFTAGPSD